MGATTRRRLFAGLTASSAVGFDRATFAAPPTEDPEKDRAAAEALQRLISESPAARALNSKEVGVLVFPKIVKVGFLLGARTAKVHLLQDGKR